MATVLVSAAQTYERAMKREEKKSETLEIRLPHTQKSEFMEIAGKRGDTASGVLRAFIDDYIAAARLAEKPNPVQEFAMTVLHHRIKTAAVAASAALSVFAVTALPSAAEESAFDRLDQNQDGVLTEGEIAPGHDAEVIELLDEDGSNSVSREEFDGNAKVKVVEKKVGDHTEVDRKIEIRKVKIHKVADGESKEYVIKKALVDAMPDAGETEIEVMTEEIIGELED